ncbi:MAG: hypothetical protein H6839_04140 [Planctomycetes bacterium]|nr:hypothetical protein [Planctomycetota bacterium]
MALQITVSKAGKSEVLGEYVFGREKRFEGLRFGSAPENDITAYELEEEHAQLTYGPNGYFFRDTCGKGFAVDGKRYEAGSEFHVKDGTRLLSAGLVFEFKRSTKPARTERDVPTSTRMISTETGNQTSLQAMAHAALKDLSMYFIGEGFFKTPGEIRRFKALLQLTIEISIEWMSSTLQGRAEFQDQFSAPVTQIYAHTLNPVKGMQDLSTIASFLLDWRDERDLEKIKQTMRDAHTDMVKHQTGLLAGVQRFVEVLQDRLNPERIKEEAGSGLLSGSKKAWDRYSELYGDTFAESSKLFNELIYPSIRKGYIFSHEDLKSDEPPKDG